MDPGAEKSGVSRYQNVSLAPAGVGHVKATGFCPSRPLDEGICVSDVVFGSHGERETGEQGKET
jgi:hypothetical protein